MGPLNDKNDGGGVMLCWAVVAEVVRCLFQIEEGIRSIGDRGEERNDEESREGAAKS